MLQDDESSIIVIEETEKTGATQDDLDINSTAHGHLVQQILESQKEFSEGTGKTQIVSKNQVFFLFSYLRAPIIYW